MEVKMDMLSLVQTLPTTAETEEGPIIEHRPGEVVVRYDLEGATGIEWVTIRFIVAVALQFTPDASVTAWMVEAFSKVCARDGSPWLAKLRGRAEEREQVVPASLRHFLVYFDHYGCLEVLAEDVKVEEGGIAIR